MPASRWNSTPLELIKWMEDEENQIKENFADLILEFMTEQHHIDPSNEEPEGENSSTGAPIPSNLPILPLRGLVVYPQIAVPLTIGQPRSIRLVDDVVIGEKLIGLVTSKNPELDNPGPEDLYSYGTVAVVHRMFRVPDGTIRLLVQGIHRFILKDFTQIEPYLRANIELAPETVEEGLEVEALARNARDQFKRIAELIPSFPRELVASIEAIEDPLLTVYTIANFQRMDLENAEAILELNSVTEKLKKLTTILTREIEVLELGKGSAGVLPAGTNESHSTRTGRNG